MKEKDFVDTGIVGLDSMLGGGLLPGRVVLVSGASGTGKTTLAMQFVLSGARQKEQGVFITLEQSKDKLVHDMAAVGFDITKSDGHITLVGGSLSDVMRFQSITRANWKDFLVEIEEIVKHAKAKRVAIDSVNLFLMLFREDDERRQALLALANMLSKMGCTALLTCEVREGTKDISWYGFEEFVVDGVITLYSMMQESSFLQGITVRKMRGLDHMKNIAPYKITGKGIVVYPDQPFIS